jgi:UDPglucose--hexose-1-phosphate uridylyltransferase
MPEIRKDLIVSRWVIVATERARRPAAFIDSVSQQTDSQNCSFCKSTEEPLLTNGRVRVFKSGTPFF